MTTPRVTDEEIAQLIKRLRAPDYWFPTAQDHMTGYWFSGSDAGHEGENNAPFAAAYILERLLAERQAEKGEAVAIPEDSALTPSEHDGWNVTIAFLTREAAVSTAKEVYEKLHVACAVEERIACSTPSHPPKQRDAVTWADGDFYSNTSMPTLHPDPLTNAEILIQALTAHLDTARQALADAAAMQVIHPELSKIKTNAAWAMHETDPRRLLPRSAKWNQSKPWEGINTYKADEFGICFVDGLGWVVQCDHARFYVSQMTSSLQEPKK